MNRTEWLQTVNIMLYKPNRTDPTRFHTREMNNMMLLAVNSVRERVTFIEPNRCNILLIPAEKFSLSFSPAVRSERSVSYRCELHPCVQYQTQGHSSRTHAR